MTTPWNPLKAAPASMPLPEALAVVLDAYSVLGSNYCEWCNGAAPLDGCGEKADDIQHEPGCAIARIVEAVNNV